MTHASPPQENRSDASHTDAALAAWRAGVVRRLDGDASFDDALVHATLEGLRIEPLYTGSGQVSAMEGAELQDGAWSIVPAVAHPSPEVANGHALTDLENGADGAAILPGPRARGLDPERGHDGVDLATLDDVAALLGDVYLDAAPLTFGSSANGLPLAAMMVALCDRRGVDTAQLQAHFGMDPIAALARDGALPGDMDDARKELFLLAETSRIKFDAARSLAVDASVWHRAGAHAAQELGYAAAAFAEMLRWLADAGLPPGAAQSEFVWRFDVGQELITEVSKLRAARALHSAVLGAFGVETATPAVLHATTSPRSLSAADPWSNLLRVSHGTLAAAIGGADLITTLPFDAPSAPAQASTLGRRTARNTPLVLKRESWLDRVGDPVRGAYAFEARTQDLASAAWKIFQDVEAKGGIVRALQDGAIVNDVATSRAALEERIRAGARRIVGVTDFPAPPETPSPPGPDASLETSHEAARDAQLAARGPMAIGAIETFDHAVAAASSGATIEELGGALVRGAGQTLAPIAAMNESDAVKETSR